MAEAAPTGYRLPTWPFVAPPELGDGAVRRYPLVIAGAGLAGLTLACDLASRGVRSVVLDEDDTVGVRGASSRGIVYAQKSLEIFDRLGVYERIREKGVTWSVGKTLAGEDVVYSFDMQQANASKQPPFINLQQFYLEWFLVERILELGMTELRWKNRVVCASQDERAVTVEVETPAGNYTLQADWLVDATGVHSAIRDGFGIETHSAERIPDRWCITDVRFDKRLPLERWTWIEAPFNENRAVWQHPMADGVWRLDYQMAADADPDHVSRPEVAAERLRAHLGPQVRFELVWVGPYTYRHVLLDSFRHGRVFFIGDAAHVVNPFGARGGNSGIADAENLAWKLALVLSGRAPEALLDSYDAERRPAAQENSRVTARTARFLAPRSEAERVLRRAVIGLAREYAFARPLVNSGRLSVANVYPPSRALPEGGRPLPNLPLVLPGGQPGYLVDLLRGEPRLVGLWFPAPSSGGVHSFAALAARGLPLAVYACGAAAEGLPAVGDPEGRLAAAMHAQPGDFCLVRPDAYLAARIPAADPQRAARAARVALCLE